MIILTLRTDNPQAELSLYDDTNQLAEVKWHAHRQLAEALHSKILELLTSQSKTWVDLEGIVCYKGPGSFTGLRIGLSVANALAVSLPAAIVSTTGDGWQPSGIDRLIKGDNEKISTPHYGAPVHITSPRK